MMSEKQGAEGSTSSNSDKAKASRARYAGWLTRAVNQSQESTNAFPSVLQAIKDRISSQLKKLQTSNDHYVSTLTDEEEIEEAE